MTCKVRWEVTQGEKREERWEEMRRVEKWGGRENRLGNDWGERRGRELKREVRRGEVRRNQEKRGGMRRDKKWASEKRGENWREKRRKMPQVRRLFSYNYIHMCSYILYSYNAQKIYDHIFNKIEKSTPYISRSWEDNYPGTTKLGINK